MDRSPQYRRLWLLTWGLCVGFAIVAVRLVYVQIINPQEAEPGRGNTPQIVRMRPALRGEIRDVQGTVLVQSQLAVVVRADPVRLGAFTPEVARIAAEHLQLPVSEVLARMQPVQYYSTNLALVTNGLSVTTNLQVELRTRRANGLATNVPVVVWDHLLAALKTNDFDIELRLKSERTNLIQRAAAQKQALPLWDVPARWRLGRETAVALKSINRAYKQVHTNLAECRVNGLFPEFVELRRYPRDLLAAHVLGFTTNATELGKTERNLPVQLYGAQGLEQRYDVALRGTPGRRKTSVVNGREFVPLRQPDVAPQDGLNVCLSLDARIQEAVERVLDDGMERLRPRALSVIVVRPDTGDVLALGNRPTYNPNDRRAENLEAFKNRAITESFEPGSTFKIVTYSAVLNEKKAALTDSINCHGGHWAVPGVRRTIHDDQGHHMGVVSVEDAFAHSSNVGAVQLGLRLQTNQFLQYVRDFGFLARTDIECAELSQFARVKNGVTNWITSVGEAAGALPGWDRLTPSSLPFGYGFRATPLQTVMAAAAIANGGVLMKPRLVRSVKTSAGEVVWDFPPQKVRRVISEEAAAEMVKVMRAAVEHGTGKPAALEDFEVAGKTGTAKKAMKGGYSTEHYYASFVGFFPANKPEVAIIVTADEPTTAGKSYYGGKACAPMFQEIAREIANVLQLTPTVIHTEGGTSAGLDSNRPTLARRQ